MPMTLSDLAKRIRAGVRLWVAALLLLDVAAVIVAMVFVIGLFPNLFLDRIKDAVSVSYRHIRDVSGEVISAAEAYRLGLVEKVCPLESLMEEADVLAAALASKGPLALGSPRLQCGKYKDAPGICNDMFQAFTYKGKFQFARASGWIGPPR